MVRGGGGGGRALKLCNLITGFLGYGNPMAEPRFEVKNVEKLHLFWRYLSEGNPGIRTFLYAVLC